MNKVVIDGIVNNITYLVKFVEYGAINAADPTTMEYYVIKYLSKPYTLQEDLTRYGQVSKSGKPVVKE